MSQSEIKCIKREGESTDRSSYSSTGLFESDESIISISDTDEGEDAPSIWTESSEGPIFSPSDDLGRECFFEETLP